MLRGRRRREMSDMSTLASVLAALCRTRDAILALCQSASVGYVPNADAEVFAGLIRDRNEAEVLAQNSGLKPENLDFTGKPIDFWPRIMQEAANQNLVAAVIENLRRRYPVV